MPVETTETVQSTPGCSLEDYSALKKLPIPFLRQLGLSEIIYQKVIAIRIPYYDEHKNVTAIRFRTALHKMPDRDDRFKWRKGSKPKLYGLWKLNEAKNKGFIIIVEGESDAQTLWYHDQPAVGLPGANSWDETWAAHFTDISKIFISIEPDCGGKAILHWLDKSSISSKAYLIQLNDIKDISELYLKDPENFQTNINLAMKNARPYSDIINERTQKERDELWLKCRVIANHPNILQLFYETIQKAGIVGETQNAKLLFLAVSGRYLAKPINIAVKGISSGGKSFTVDQVLKFFPPEAYHAFTSMSERALVYWSEPLEHRYLVFFEYAGIADGIQEVIIRSLLSEGQIRYLVTERSNETGQFQHRMIEKNGPTGLLITTTKHNIHPENETRILSLFIDDSNAQTADVLIALARPHKEEIDYTPWHTFHKWLGLGPKKVVIPYAVKLAEKIPAVAVRLRRDFSQILSLISSHALLHQANRQKDENGNILAQIDDYRAIRELVVDIISQGLDMSVSKAEKETVNIVTELDRDGQKEITITMIANKLNLHKTTVLRRVNTCISKGYLINEEDRKGKPARIKLGDPLPLELTILPLPEDLEANGCTVAPISQGIDTPLPQSTSANVGSEATDLPHPQDHNLGNYKDQERVMERIAILQQDGNLSYEDAVKQVQQECEKYYDSDINLF